MFPIGARGAAEVSAGWLIVGVRSPLDVVTVPEPGAVASSGTAPAAPWPVMNISLRSRAICRASP